MKRGYEFSLLWIACLLVSFVTGCAAMAQEDREPRDLELIDSWSGDLPVTGLDLLPEGQRQSRTGVIGGPETFAAVWRAFQPEQEIPSVDFNRNLVVFSRNVKFYNRTRIFKVTLTGGGIDVLAMETMSAMPIKEKVAMALAVISREGVRFIRVGEKEIPVANAW